MAGKIVKSDKLRGLDKFRRRIGWLLEHEKFPEVEKMLLSGASIARIARYIATWDDVAKLGFTLSKIRSDLAYLRRNYPRLKNLDIVKYYEDLRKAELELNELKEMIELYKIQKDRIMVDYRLEKDVLKKLIPTLSKEMQVALEMLKAIAVLKDKLNGKYSFRRVEQLPDAESGEVQISDKSIKNVLDFIEKVLKINKEGSYEENEVDTENK